MIPRLTTGLIVLLVLIVPGIAYVPTAMVFVAGAQEKLATEEGKVCGYEARNGHDNIGLRGDKESPRKTLTDAEWGRYVDFLLTKNYSADCTMTILRAAVKSQREGGPLPLGLITTYTEFLINKKK